MLISAVLPIMSIYHLPHGQYAYSGHVINLPQDVASFTITLPRLPSNLDIIVVRKEGAAESHCDFRVRRSVVLLALQWLLSNNIYYRNIRMDPNALALLPEDGNLTGLCTMTLESSDDQELPSPQDVDPYDAHLARTFVPSTAQKLTEQETIQQSINERQSHQSPHTVPWPSSGSPINEFNTEGYISCTVPFPPLSQPFALLLRCLCRTSGSVSFVSAPSPAFLFLR